MRTELDGLCGRPLACRPGADRDAGGARVELRARRPLAVDRVDDRARARAAASMIARRSRVRSSLVPVPTRKPSDTSRHSLRPGSGARPRMHVLERVQRGGRVAQRIVEHARAWRSDLLLGDRLLRLARNLRARVRGRDGGPPVAAIAARGSAGSRARCRAGRSSLRAASRRADESPRRISSACAGVICEPAAGGIAGWLKLSWSMACLGSRRSC